jgi:hypothetical protein
MAFVENKKGGVDVVGAQQKRKKEAVLYGLGFPLPKPVRTRTPIDNPGTWDDGNTVMMNDLSEELTKNLRTSILRGKSEELRLALKNIGEQKWAGEADFAFRLDGYTPNTVGRTKVLLTAQRSFLAALDGEGNRKQILIWDAGYSSGMRFADVIGGESTVTKQSASFTHHLSVFLNREHRPHANISIVPKLSFVAGLDNKARDEVLGRGKGPCSLGCGMTRSEYGDELDLGLERFAPKTVFDLAAARLRTFVRRA